MKVASIGECMIELSQVSDGVFARGFGGDTLNTAVYLSRLGIDTTYVTALGDDALSSTMVTNWNAEGIDTREVLRVPGALPGLYMIERNAKGERSFLYWRSQAPARRFFDLADDATLDRLSRFDWLYLSGISLSLYSDSGLERLFTLLKTTRTRGGRIAFDGNFRPRGWPDRETAQRTFNRLLPLVDLALPTGEDEQALFGDTDAAATIARLASAGVKEIVVKRGPDGCLIAANGEIVEVAPPVVVSPVDTTAAGDSFNAGYLAARIGNASIRDAALAGHRLASAVIMLPGAVIPRDQMPQASIRTERTNDRQ
jgi:2-dehydro-3-deoxygluconokinase